MYLDVNQQEEYWSEVGAPTFVSLLQEQTFSFIMQTQEGQRDGICMDFNSAFYHAPCPLKRALATGCQEPVQTETSCCRLEDNVPSKYNLDGASIWTQNQSGNPKRESLNCLTTTES